MTSPNISVIIGNPEERTVVVNWTSTAGNYDLRSYKVELFQNGTEIESKSISSDSDMTEAIFTVPFKPVVEFYANIITVSVCNLMSNGVSTDPLLLTSSGGKLI